MPVINKDAHWNKLILIFAILILIISITYVKSTSRQIIRIRDGKTISFRDMVEEVSSAEVIFIGEKHDDPAHHKTQLDVIKALYETGSHLAIGLEMFRNNHQKTLDAWIAGKVPERSFFPIFLENWGFGWELYRDIFFFAREHDIPLIGLNVPNEITRKVGKKGFRSLTDEELMQLPPGVTCELNEEYMDHLMEVFQYKKSSDREFLYFCEAQVLWDQAMAWYLSEYMKNNPGRTVIVLAGAIHAWKYGIPKQKQRYISVEHRVIVPELPVGRESISENDADYLMTYS
jgi:uncharacterized iron-regulated protein